jgi:hypothetical protein
VIGENNQADYFFEAHGIEFSVRMPPKIESGERSRFNTMKGDK